MTGPAGKEPLATIAGISIMKTMSITEIQRMTVRERLEVMEQIWDSLHREKIEPVSPHWHEGILQKRKEIMDSPDARYLSIKELRERHR